MRVAVKKHAKACVVACPMACYHTTKCKHMSSLLLKLADGEGQSIRGKELEGTQYFSVYDFMTKACAYKDTGASAR